MEDIQNKVIQNYSTNLSFLEKYDKELFNRIQGLSYMIQTGEYKERYRIEYIKENNSFDIYDTKNELYLYNNEAEKFDKDALKNTNFDKLNSFDLFSHDFYNFKEKIKISESLPILEQLTQKVANDISDYTNVFNTSTLDSNKTFKQIDRFVFVGTLLGSHIEKIDKKISAKAYFICENNLEIFRLSLFVCQYFKLAQKSLLQFSIMDDEDILYPKLEAFLYRQMRANYMLKYYSTNYNISNYFESILKAIVMISPFKFTYYRRVYQVLDRGVENMNQFSTFKTVQQYDFFGDQPILYVAAGPSLNKNIEWIKKHKKNFFIVSIGAAVKKLVENGVLPNLITSADAGEHTVEHFPLEIRNEIKNIPILCTQITHKDVLDIFENVFLYEAMTILKDTSTVIEGASVGEVSLHLLLLMGATNIYMIGTDLALDQETGSTHGDDYKYGKKIELNESHSNHNSFMQEGTYSTKDTILKVKGNFRENVSTTTVFAKSLISYRNIINSFKGKGLDINIFNLSDGAYIDNTLPLELDSVNLNENDIECNIIKFLEENSNVSFTHEEKFKINYCVNFIEKVINNLESFNKTKIKSYKSFLSERQYIVNMIANEAARTNLFGLTECFSNYLWIVEPYIAYQFNTKNLENESKLVKQVKKIWINHLIHLLTIFKSSLKKAL